MAYKQMTFLNDDDGLIEDAIYSSIKRNNRTWIKLEGLGRKLLEEHFPETRYMSSLKALEYVKERGYVLCLLKNPNDDTYDIYEDSLKPVHIGVTHNWSLITFTHLEITTQEGLVETYFDV